MDAQKFQTHWVKLQPKIKQKWAKFTEEELKQINGKQDVFLSKLQAKYGIDREQAIQEVQNLEKELAGAGATSTTGKQGQKKSKKSKR